MTAKIAQVTQARRRAGRQLGFYIHAAVFAAVNLVLIAINISTTPAHAWSVFPLLGWGFGLLMHGMAALGPLGRVYRSLVDRELARLSGSQDARGFRTVR